MIWPAKKSPTSVGSWTTPGFCQRRSRTRQAKDIIFLRAPADFIIWASKCLSPTVKWSDFSCWKCEMIGWVSCTLFLTADIQRLLLPQYFITRWRWMWASSAFTASSWRPVIQSLAVPVGLPGKNRESFHYQKHSRIFPWRTAGCKAETAISHFIRDLFDFDLLKIG